MTITVTDGFGATAEIEIIDAFNRPISAVWLRHFISGLGRLIRIGRNQYRIPESLLALPMALRKYTRSDWDHPYDVYLRSIHHTPKYSWSTPEDDGYTWEMSLPGMEVDA